MRVHNDHVLLRFGSSIITILHKMLSISLISCLYINPLRIWRPILFLFSFIALIVNLFLAHVSSCRITQSAKCTSIFGILQKITCLYSQFGMTINRSHRNRKEQEKWQMKIGIGWRKEKWMKKKTVTIIIAGSECASRVRAYTSARS